MSELIIPEWPYAYSGPQGSGIIKAQPDDFVVEEFLPFTPEGSGEHVFLYLEKCGENTEFIARQLARFAGVRQRDVSYAGLKDRHGRTRQWFSIWLPGKAEPDWYSLNSAQLKILEVVRHARKLKRGVLAANQFTVVIRNWQGDQAVLLEQLQRIQQQGFPNYFGEQRFGIKGQNINKALAMFQGQSVKREQRSIYFSAARSYLFNIILAERVQGQTWNQLMMGEVCQLQNSNSQFPIVTVDEQLLARVQSADIHPTGVLFGNGKSAVTADVEILENRLLSQYPALLDGLAKADLQIDRRSLRVMPEELVWQWLNADSLQLSFRLPAGSYATCLLREIVKLASA